jgi:hypothetical protein
VACFTYHERTLTLPAEHPISGSNVTAAFQDLSIFDLSAGRLPMVKGVYTYEGLPVWSADGMFLAYLTVDSADEDFPVESSVTVMSETGEIAATFSNSLAPSWSRDGHRLALRQQDKRRILIHDMDRGDEQAIDVDSIPIGWSMSTEILVGGQLEFVPDRGVEVPQAIQLLNPVTGATRPVEGRPIYPDWSAPDGSSMVVFGGNASQAHGGIKLNVVDLNTAEIRSIDGGAIGFGSEGIPTEHLVYSSDGQRIWWGDQTTTTVYDASSSGGVASPLFSNPAAQFFSFSPWLGRVAYLGGGSGVVMVRSLYDDAETRSLEAAWPLAWRPVFSR